MKTWIPREALSVSFQIALPMFFAGFRFVNYFFRTDRTKVREMMSLHPMRYEHVDSNGDLDAVRKYCLCFIR